MQLSVIVLQYGGSEMTREAILSFQKHCGTDHEILLVDNASPDPRDREAIRAIPGARILQLDKNLGYGTANNRAAREARGEILLFLNNDTITTDDFVSPALDEFATDPTVGLVGPRLLNRDGTDQLCCGALPGFFREALDRFLYRAVDRNTRFGRWYATRHARTRRRVGWVTGAAMFVRRRLFEALGGFDEQIFLYFEDKDLCARSRKARSPVLFSPRCRVVHLRGGSAREGMRPALRKIYRASQRHYYAKHRPRLEQALLRFYQAIST